MERAVYNPLPSTRLNPGAVCRQLSNFTTVTLQSPALCVMTDFRRVTPATVRPDATLSEATKIMISRGVRLLFVAELDDVVIGVITARDTMGERPIKLVQERGCKHRDLTVADVMTPRTMMDTLAVGDVLRAEVGHVLRTLEHFGRQHAVVVEHDPVAKRDEIRGMFSATAIGRHLGVPIQTFEVAKTFAEIEAALAAT